MNIILVHESALAFEGVRAVHFSVIRREDYDCVAEHVIFTERVYYAHQIIVAVLNAVEVVILIIFPDVRACDFSGKNAPVVIIELYTAGDILCVNVKFQLDGRG